ncbi:putative L-type lectin-domain containing receptor kinase S.5 [Vitis vinifera]|uniref:Putative L-type lectin-domain containing receptor kinase S.5 n=1 Tax=Vitis vinifera TaxID=29760 RepID=A0A438HAD9_VITVI|nr:putative L-type lectin-domain containing receptor kinase S.5 [Vitis vinifera]
MLLVKTSEDTKSLAKGILRVDASMGPDTDWPGKLNSGPSSTRQFGRDPTQTINPSDQTHHSTKAIAGTPGYMAPESLLVGRATVQTDVYAFGILVLEVRGSILDVVDLQLNEVFVKEEAECVLMLALACCHPNPNHRPSMRIALRVRAGEVAPPVIPMDKPAFVWPPAMPPSSNEDLEDYSFSLPNGWTRDLNPQRFLIQSLYLQKASGQGVRTHPPMVLLAMVYISARSTVPLINGGEIFYVVMMTLDGTRAIITLRVADRDRGRRWNVGHDRLLCPKKPAMCLYRKIRMRVTRMTMRATCH